ESAERNTFGHERLRLTRLNGVANASEIGGDLPSEHLQVPRAPKAGRQARIADGLQRDGTSAFVNRAARRYRVAARKRHEIETVCHHEGVRDEVDAATGQLARSEMTPLTR